jgi:hypothetical protein
MKKLMLAAVAALMLVAFAPAQGGAKMQGKPHMPHGNMAAGMKMGQMSTHECCMQGLSAVEKKNAMAMMRTWNAGERSAWDARCSMCMRDPHTALMAMEHKRQKPTDAMIQQHMMGGLSKAQQKGMGMIMADKKHAGLLMKMAENCCMYGVKHAK